MSLFACSKKEKQLWLTEFSRAIEWSDGVSPAKANKIRKTSNVAATQSEG